MFENIWILICKKHKGLDKPQSKETISADQLKSLCSQMYHRGLKDGKIGSNASDRNSGRNEKFSDMFGDLFGGMGFK